MTINEKKIEYIDKEAFRILELLEETKEEKEEPTFDKGSLGHLICQDLSEYLVDSPYLIAPKKFGETAEVKECYKGSCIGFNEKNYIEFSKLVSTIYKEQEINTVVSNEFIKKRSFKWFLKTYKAKKAENNFSSYILDEIQNSIEEYKVHYSILYLDIGRPIQVGKVKFEFFTKEYFDSIVQQYNITHPDSSENPYELMREKYQGRVYATYCVKAEKVKAKEIALEQCSLAVDILKICSETTDIPQNKLSFDIDCRTKENVQNELIITIPPNLDNKFHIETYRLPSYHRIYEDEWKRILQKQIGDFHNFLLTLDSDKTELKQLIVNGIKRYGNAISNQNLHQRVVELFTILESLLLPNQNSPIIESVCKYCSKLVFKKPEERKELILLLKSMYEIRSALIHHAKENSIDIEKLRKLQYIVIMLLLSLIEKTSLHKTKQSLLDEIDDAILNAY